MKTVIASSCSCGLTCRWHGKKCYKTKAIKDLEAQGIRVIPVCPEMLGGLPCPRPPVKSIRGRVFQVDAETRSQISKEVSREFLKGAEESLAIAIKNGAKEAYMFKMSPSCAYGGITGKFLRANGIEVVPIW